MKVNNYSGQINKTNDREVLVKQLKDVATGMEEQFANLLIQEMKKSVDKNEEGSSAMKIYESYLDQEYARIMADQGSLGLSDVIVEQLAPKMNLNIETKKNIIKKHPQNNADAAPGVTNDRN